MFLRPTSIFANPMTNPIGNTFTRMMLGIPLSIFTKECMVLSLVQTQSRRRWVSRMLAVLPAVIENDSINSPLNFLIVEVLGYWFSFGMVYEALRWSSWIAFGLQSTKSIIDSLNEDMWFQRQQTFPVHQPSSQEERLQSLPEEEDTTLYATESDKTDI